jgi:cytochrome P450
VLKSDTMFCAKDHGVLVKPEVDCHIILDWNEGCIKKYKPVIKETLRVYPSIPMSEPRVVPPNGTMIYRYEIPGGTICSLQPNTENRDSGVFPDPDKFDPERWMLDHESENTRK